MIASGLIITYRGLKMPLQLGCIPVNVNENPWGGPIAHNPKAGFNLVEVGRPPLLTHCEFVHIAAR